MAIPELREIWEFLSSCPRLEDFAEAHKGVEWNVDLANHESLLVADTPFPDSRLGVPPRATFNSFEQPFLRYLNFDKKYRLYDAFGRPWERPKVIMNKTRRSRDMWRVTAFADFDGLACFETFFAVWPKDPSLTYVLEAVLNGPIANAYLAVHCGRREFTIKAVNRIPFPRLSARQIADVNRLTASYKDEVATLSTTFGPNYSKADRLLREIDAITLAAFGLSPRLERQLLDFFNESVRMVPFAFGDYYPKDMKSYIPLGQFLSPNYQRATADDFVKRAPVIEDEAISDILAELG